MSCVSTPAFAKLPKGFVYLRDVDPSIIQEMRYFTSHNFVGRRVDGYLAGECILTKRAADALRRVQASLKQQRLSLKVYDCYRPMRAVRHFIRWARNPRDTLTRREFYPTLDKTKLFRLGYISTRSAHARGSTLDLTIVALPAARQPRYDVNRQVPCHYPQGRRYGDNSLDFGTGYDCFHARSHTWNREISVEATANRKLLLKEMERAGFRNYRKEWWHFELRNEPFRATQFDFPIVPRKAAANQVEPRKVRATPGPQPPALRPPKPQATAKYDRLVLVGPCSGEQVTVYRGRPPERLRTAAELLPSDVETISGFCEGAEPSLKTWHKLGVVERQQTGEPWCQTKISAAGKTIRGWISGRFLFEAGQPKPKCVR
ncbi:MAG: M15 family metallopeptidase [Hyphomicrobiaceae bacterium]|nr:M15 family metallopeptidase [Hyphomicrobiaceae bacterium]